MAKCWDLQVSGWHHQVSPSGQTCCHCRHCGVQGHHLSHKSFSDSVETGTAKSFLPALGAWNFAAVFKTLNKLKGSPLSVMPRNLVNLSRTGCGWLQGQQAFQSLRWFVLKMPSPMQSELTSASHLVNLLIGCVWWTGVWIVVISSSIRLLTFWLWTWPLTDKSAQHFLLFKKKKKRNLFGQRFDFPKSQAILPQFDNQD